MFKLFRRFAKSETGAITVDWVVLTAAAVGLAGASVVLVGDGVISLSGSIGEGVEEQTIGALE